MPVYGTTGTARTNRVFRAIGGFNIAKGNLTLTRTMDQATTATVVAQDVSAAEMAGLLKQPGSRISVLGDEMIVESTSYSVNRVYPNGRPFETYNISVRMRQRDEDVKIWDGGGGGGVGLRLIDRIVDGENSDVLFTGGYRDAELTFGEQNQESAGDEPEEGEPRTIFRLKNQKTETFTEGDENPEEPPINTRVLRDFSSNFDETGPKKMIKESKRKAGQLESEKITTYGFAYIARQVQLADGETIYDDDPGRFWVPIEEKQTTYFYSKAGSTTFSVRVRPPGTGETRSPVRFIVHPDYAQFARFSADGISFRSNAEYLTRQVTTGWKLVRFIKEPHDGNTSADVDTDDPLYPLFDFVRIPFYAETLYSLRSTRREYSDDEQDDTALPFRIEWTNYKSLPLSMRSAFSDQDVTDDGTVAILYPDPNYVEPMFISAESSMSCSFDWRLDPDGEVDPDAFIPGTNRPAPPPRFTTGEESYNAVRRKVINNDRYTEYIVNYSSQDPGFDNSAEQFSFREVAGTPPEPQYRVQQFEATQVPSNQTIFSSFKPTERTFITAIFEKRLAEFVDEGGSVSVPEAETLNDAIKKVELDLIKAYAQNSPSNITDIGFNPGIKPGDSCSAGELLPSGGARLVTGVTVNIEFHGTNNATGGLLMTTAGTSLTVGPYRKPEITIDTETQENPGEQEPRFDASIDVEIESTPGDVGFIFPDLPNRRNF